MKRTQLEKAEAGEFLREWGKNTCVAVSEALAIGRVKWTAFPLGHNGKDNIDFYMQAADMLRLCREIKNGVFDRKIAADAANAYPSAYRYVTGKDGCIRLNIGAGKAGVRIQLQDTVKKKNHITAVAMDALKDMAEDYLLFTGLTPTTSPSYYAGLVGAFVKASEERVKKYGKAALPEDQTEAGSEDSYVEEDVQDAAVTENTEAEPARPEPVKSGAGKPVQQEKKQDVPAGKGQDKAPAAAAQDDVQHFKLHVHAAVQEMQQGKFYGVSAQDGSETVTLMFKKEQADTFGWFASFREKAASKGVDLNFLGQRKGKYILYVKTK